MLTSATGVIFFGVVMVRLSLKIFAALKYQLLEYKTRWPLNTSCKTPHIVIHIVGDKSDIQREPFVNGNFIRTITDTVRNDTHPTIYT